MLGRSMSMRAIFRPAGAAPSGDRPIERVADADQQVVLSPAEASSLFQRQRMA